MAADVVLNGDALELHGNVVAMDGEISSTGKIAGFSFSDRSDPSKRYVLYAQSGNIRLYQQGVGDILLIQPQGKTAPFVNEVASQGPVAGFSFTDRSNASDRYVLYADKGNVRLWKNKLDILKIADINGHLVVDGEDMHVKQDMLFDKLSAFKLTISYNVVQQIPGPGKIGGVTSVRKEYDLAEKISELEARIAQLEKKLNV